MIEADEVFNAADFQSIKLSVQFKNLMTGIDVKNSAEISLMEIGDKALVFEIPARSCNVKHNVMFHIGRSDTKSKKSEPMFSATGKVSDLENLDEGRDRVTVDLVQYEERELADLMALFSSRQEEIENFFAAVRG